MTWRKTLTAVGVIGATGAVGTFAALFRAVDAGPGAVGRLAGAINVGLGVMNLMPVYPLDGGHIVNRVLEARGASPGARPAIRAHDYAARGVAERAGFHAVARASVLDTEVGTAPVHIPYDAPVEMPRPETAPALAQMLEQTPTLTAWERLLPLGWRFRRMIPELVRGLAKDRRAAVALHAERAETAQAAVLFAGHDDAVVVSVLEGAVPGMQALF